MLNKNVFVFMFMFVGCSLSAQHSFFIRPRAMMKTNRSFYGIERFFMHRNQTNYADNGYYTFVNNGYHFYNSKINLGISAGIQFNKKSSLELVVSADGSSTSSSFTYYRLSSYANPPFYYATSGLRIWGRDFNRVNLEYNYRFKDKKQSTLRGMFGLGFFLPHTRTEIDAFGMNNDKFIADVIETNTNYSKLAPILQFGFGIDFKTKRNVPLFSFDISATVNFQTRVQMVSYEVTLQDLSDGQIYNFEHYLFSRGSGINFQLSRPINIYPWRPNKKPKNTEL